MSYLLDALRKSEDLKKRGAAPTIHSADHHVQAKSVSHWIGLAALVLLPLLVLLAWYRWSGQGLAENAQSDGRGTATVESPAGSPSLPEPAQPRQGTAGQDTAPVSNTAPVILDMRRTPVEQLENGSQKMARGQQADRESESVTQSGGSIDATDRPASINAANREEQASGDGAGQQNPATTQPEEYRALLPGLVQVWELPESVRSDLVDMKISVLVYAEHPEDRFILMNGKRWVEGDEPQPGLVLREIRREGVVFTYRLYRFLVSQ